MPKKFNFKLNAVLRVRRLRADSHRRVVADRLRRISELGRKAQAMQTQIGNELDAARRAAAERHLDVHSLSSRRFWVAHLQRLALQADQDVVVERQTLAGEQQQLAHAVKELRVLEKLRDRAQQRHRLAAERVEQAELDDLVLGRWVAVPATEQVES